MVKRATEQQALCSHAISPSQGTISLQPATAAGVWIAWVDDKTVKGCVRAPLPGPTRRAAWVTSPSPVALLPRRHRVVCLLPTRHRLPTGSKLPTAKCHPDPAQTSCVTLIDSSRLIVAPRWSYVNIAAKLPPAVVSRRPCTSSSSTLPRAPRSSRN